MVKYSDKCEHLHIMSFFNSVDIFFWMRVVLVIMSPNPTIVGTGKSSK